MRRALVGFLVAAGGGLVADVAMIVAMDTSGDDGAASWWLINFPSLPWLHYCMGPPPLGETEMGPWDYTVVFVSITSSCLSWGLVGACLGWLAGSSADDPPSLAPGAATGEQASQPSGASRKTGQREL
jgi:hypothetical protein